MIPKVSVIIPVYGVEKYIEQCARSLFEQTLDSIEYLFIDDCTPDRSIEILKRVLEEYPNRKSQVIIHRMERNSGQAAVRKWGMLNATGDYQIHCDSDDWVDTSMYKKLYDAAIDNDADIVFCDFCKVNNDEKLRMNKAIEKGDTNYFLIGKILLQEHSLNYLWSAMVSRNLLENAVLYPKNNLGEDYALMIQFLYYSKKFVHIHTPLYYYRINPNSICRVQTREAVLSKMTDRVANLNLVLEFLEKHGLTGQFKDIIVSSKMSCRYWLRPLRKEANFKKLWNKSYPEINKQIYNNPYISFKMKFYNLLVNMNLGFLV